MPLVRRLARPMLASIFVSGGIDAFRAPHGRAALAGPVAQRFARALPVALPEDPVQLVRIDAGVKVLAGLLLATGRLPRVAAAALASSLVPTTLAGHRFWEYDDPKDRGNQRIHFLKNLGLLGGLLLAAVDTGGKPSVAWLAGHAAKGGKRRTRKAAKKLRSSLPGD